MANIIKPSVHFVNWGLFVVVLSCDWRGDCFVMTFHPKNTD